MNSNRRMIDFQEEEIRGGDMGVPITDNDIFKNKNSSKENNISNISVNVKINKDKKSDVDLFNNRILSSSVSAFLETDGTKPISIDDNFWLYYWKYFKLRELCLVCFMDDNETLPYFVRWSCFAFCIITIFLFNCFFFFESNVHKRYLNALGGKKNRLGYYFKKEFGTTVCVALLSCVLKMLIIKLVLYKLFKIRREDKKMMKYSAEKGLSQNELEELHEKRNKFMKMYELKLLIYFLILMALSIIFSYFSICYTGVFHNSVSAFLYGFLFCFIMTIIFCAVFCLIIVSIYKLGKHLKNKCLLSTYIVLGTLY